MDSYLVQVWVAADGTSPLSQLRGVVRHVATGAETPFRNDEEVLGVLRQASHRRPGADQVRSTTEEEVR